MRPTRNLPPAGALRAALAAAALAIASAATAAPTWRLVDLGAQAHARGLGAHHEVAGDTPDADGRPQAAVFRDGAWQLRQAPGAPWAGIGQHLNRRGAMSGIADDPASQAFTAALWRPDGRFVPLLPLGSSPSSQATDIAPDGSVLVVQATRSFRWKDGTLEPIDPPPGSAWFVAQRVNASGEVAGTAASADGSTTQAALWTGKAWHLAGTLGGVAASVADLDDDGHFVGSALPADGSTGHAFLFDGVAMRDLGTLGGAGSVATGLDRRDVVVGQAQDARGRWQAFVWKDGTMWRLDDRVVDAPGWTLTAAADIDDGGVIVGNGLYQGVPHAWMLVPATR